MNSNKECNDNDTFKTVLAVAGVALGAYGGYKGHKLVKNAGGYKVVGGRIKDNYKNIGSHLADGFKKTGKDMKDAKGFWNSTKTGASGVKDTAGVFATDVKDIFKPAKAKFHPNDLRIKKNVDDIVSNVDDDKIVPMHDLNPGTGIKDYNMSNINTANDMFNPTPYTVPNVHGNYGPFVGHGPTREHVGNYISRTQGENAYIQFATGLPPIDPISMETIRNIPVLNKNK